MVNNKDRRDAQMAYRADKYIFEEMSVCRGKSENAFLTPPFFCDYGSHIEVGKNFSTNYNCTIPDMNMGRKLRLEIMYGSVEVQ